MREGSCSLEKQLIEILVQVKLIFNSIWQGFFDPLFDPGVGTKMDPFQYFFSNHNFHFNEILHKIACYLEILKM